MTTITGGAAPFYLARGSAKHDNLFVVAGKRGVIVLTYQEGKLEKRQVSQSAMMLGLVFGGDGTTIFAGDSNGHVHKIVNGKLKELFKVHSGPIGALAYDYKKNEILAAGGRHGSKKIKRVALVAAEGKREECKVVSVVRLEESPISLDYYKEQLLVGHKDGSIMVIDAQGSRHQAMSSHS